MRQFCDRVILIEDSSIVAQGDAEDVAAQYTRLLNPAAPEAQPVAKAQDEPSAEAQEQPKRWGEGGMRYAKVSVPTLLADESTLALEVEAVAEQDVDEPVYGFVIKSSSGAPILGTNSLLKRQRTGTVRKGERVRVTWLVPNVFSDGLHHVELAVTDRDGLTVYDWWEEAASFTVIKEEKTPYIVTPDTTLVIAKE